jgi:hypothetical protein
MGKTQRLDPYWEVLRIPPEEQPPDYYRLLGVKRFEQDSEVIKEHVSRRTRWVIMHKKGVYAKACADLIYQINAAKTCLLNPRLKAAYDRKLQVDQPNAQEARPGSPTPGKGPVAAKTPEGTEASSTDGPRAPGARDRAGPTLPGPHERAGPGPADAGFSLASDPPDGTPPPADFDDPLGAKDGAQLESALSSSASAGESTREVYGVLDEDEFDFLEKVDEPEDEPEDENVSRAHPFSPGAPRAGKKVAPPAEERTAQRANNERVRPPKRGDSPDPARRGAKTKEPMARAPVQKTVRQQPRASRPATERPSSGIDFTHSMEKSNPWIPEDAGYELVGPARSVQPAPGRPQDGEKDVDQPRGEEASDPEHASGSKEVSRRPLRRKAIVVIAFVTCLVLGGVYLSGALWPTDSSPAGQPPERAERSSPQAAGVAPSIDGAGVREQAPRRGPERTPTGSAAEPSSPEGAAEPPSTQSAAGPSSARPGRGEPRAAGAVGTIEIGVAHSLEKRAWLEWAAEEFAVSEMGQAVRVNLIPMESAQGARAVVGGDARIHVWAPASKLYREAFRSDWLARHGRDPKWRRDPIVKEEDLVLTPLVIIMWKDRYQAFTKKAPDLSLKTLGHAMHAETGWRAIAGKPQWGLFKLGHAHPSRSDCGVMTVVMLAYDFYGKTSGLTVRDVVAPEFQQHLAWFASGVAGTPDSTEELVKDAILRGPSMYDALIVYESVAIDCLDEAEGRWDELQVCYPGYNVWSDHSYYVLDTPWTTEAHQEAAGTFLAFLMSEPVQARALDYGFRPGNPSVPLKSPDSPFVRHEQNGLRADVGAVCEPPSREVWENLQQSWTRSAGRP